MVDILITGNTFPVKERLRALGGKWSPQEKGWFVPSNKAEEARALVADVQNRAPQYSSATRRSWRPCGYPGCSPNFCDECDGEGYRNGR